MNKRNIHIYRYNDMTSDKILCIYLLIYLVLKYIINLNIS